MYMSKKEEKKHVRLLKEEIQVDKRLEKEVSDLKAEAQELEEVGVEAGRKYEYKKTLTLLRHLIENIKACTDKQEEADKFNAILFNKSNVDGKVDVQKNDAVAKKFKKIMFWIEQNHCAKDAKALANNMTKPVGTKPGFNQALTKQMNIGKTGKPARKGPMIGGPSQSGGRRQRRSNMSRKRRTKCGRRKTKCQRRSRRKNTRKRRKNTERRR
jgi:hypothetical protein